MGEEENIYAESERDDARREEGDDWSYDDELF